MKKLCLLCSLLLLFVLQTTAQVSWEKLFSKESSDVFRSVQEVSAGGYVLAGYSADSTVNDTDAYVVRLNTMGDTIWTFSYNGPLSKKDLFYKVVPLSDGGFVMCGYTTSVTGLSDDMLYVKINSSGQLVWAKTLGGTLKERAQDIVQTADGKFMMVGYTTSPPAQYYDAYLIRLDENGDTLWTKRFGGSNYDDANSIKLLSDGGFILGGQSYNGATNGFDMYLIRINSSGDTLWTKKHGTTGIDNIEHIAVTSTGQFVLAGGTTGGGLGGNDAIILKTDANGNELWRKVYGGTEPDDFHRIEVTSDGGLIASGTTRSFAPLNPNGWLVRTDAAGDTLWTRTFGGDNHDHGYSAIEASDGGYLIVGHSGSFGFNNEDGYAAKTNSLGIITNPMVYTTVFSLISPTPAQCGSANTQINVLLRNFGSADVPNVPITIEITGSLTQTLTATYNGTLHSQDADQYLFSTTINTAAGGTYNFRCYTGNGNDVYPERNELITTVTLEGNTGAPAVTGASRCGTGQVTLTATSAGTVYWFADAIGGTQIATGQTYSPTLSSTTTFYAQTGLACPSARVPVVATINPGLSDPAVTGDARCGTGTLTLTATSADPVLWFDASSGGNQVGSGLSFTTPSLSGTTTYFAEANDGTCTSNRVAAIATVNAMPADPVAGHAGRCGSGTVTLTATSSDAVTWFDAPVGGNQVGTGSSFITPSLTSTTDYYAEADNGTCASNRVTVTASINSSAADPVTIGDTICGQGSATLTASSPDPVFWYDAPSGGTQVGTGTTFFTPVISSNTTYYAVSDNGCTSNPVPADVIVFGQPSVSVGNDTVLSSGSQLTIDAGAGFSTYQWTTGESTQSITVSATDTFCVTVTDGNGCTASDCIFVDFSTAVNSLQGISSIGIYPNPADRQLSFVFENEMHQVKIELMDITGKIVHSEIADIARGGTKTLPVDKLPAGIYIARLSADGFLHTSRVIISH